MYKKVLCILVLAFLLPQVAGATKLTLDPVFPLLRDTATWRWHIEVVDAMGNVGKYTSLALDTGGRPCISYADVSSMGILKYACFDGSSWAIEAVDGPGVDFSSSSLPASGEAQIAYHGNSMLKYARKKSGGGWVIQVVDASSLETGWYPSLALDATKGLPYIGYYDWNTHRLRYAFYDPDAGWQTMTVDSDDAGEYVSLALDSSGHPHMSYYKAVLGDLRYAHLDGSSWHIETVDAEGDTGQHTSLALDAEGHPHISYFDRGN
ncbi:MAG: hypothetical protein QW260_05575, partial [Thermoproteota archaeon]